MAHDRRPACDAGRLGVRHVLPQLIQKKTEERVKRALSESAVEAEVEHVTDPTAIADYGVFVTPGLVVDGEVKLSGHVPSRDDIKPLLRP